MEFIDTRVCEYLDDCAQSLIMKTLSILCFLIYFETYVECKQILLVQGQHTKVEIWKQRADQSHVDLIYGAYDVASCKAPCISLLGSTWTSGRNILAKSAYHKEILNKRPYDYWTFADADVAFHCIVPNIADDFQDMDRCFVLYMQFVKKARQPVVALLSMEVKHVVDPLVDKYGKAVTKLDSFDAIVNTFSRDVIHIFLPYMTDLDNNSWWSSQAILWYFLQCLSPKFATAPLYILYGNPEHNAYPRNKRDVAMEQVVAQRRLNGVQLPLPPLDKSLDFSIQGVERVDNLNHTWYIGTDNYQHCNDAMKDYSLLFFKT